MNGLLGSGLGLFLYSRAPQNPKHQAFGIYCLSLSIWSYFYCAWHLTDSEETALLLVRLLMAGAILIPITHLYHVLTFLGLFNKHRRLLLAGSILTLLLLLFDFTPLMVDRVEGQMGFAYWPRPGIVFPVFLLWFIFSLTYATYLFARAYRNTKGMRRNQYLVLITGSLIGWGGGASNFPLWYGVPLPPYGTILVSLYFVAMAFSLIRYRIFDFTLAIEKSVTFLFPLAVIALPAFAVFLYAQEVYFQKINFEFSVVLLVVVTLLIILAYRIMSCLHIAVSKTLFRERHDMYEALSRFSKSLVTNLKLKPLTREIVHMLGQVMGIQRVVLYLVETERGGFIPMSQFGIDTNTEQLPRLTFEDRLPKHLTTVQAIVIREELEDASESSPLHELKADLEARGIDVCLPLMNKGRLLGFCALGPKTSLASYTSLDIDLLTTLSHEAAIALDNALLYEELKRSQALVRRTDRLRSLETMAGGLAHEIRNPLTSIKAFVDLVPERATDKSFVTRFGQVVKEDVLRIERLTKEILDYARPAEPFLKYEDMNEIIESCLYALRVRASHEVIVIETDLAHDLPTVYVDRQQIKQVLLNLFLNATESMSTRGGTLTVRSYTVSQDDEKFWVQIEVRDTGAGIAQNDLEHIFDPFFTTKHHSEEHEGTGLGLAISHQIIQEHHGHVEVKSELGKGATFFINLPVPDRSAQLVGNAEDMSQLSS
ncbi:ATP-binding protein [Nitrospira sp. M1]